MAIDLESLKLLNELAAHLYQVSADHGFHDDDDNPLRFCAYTTNLHDEVSELNEALRTGCEHHPCNKAEKMKALGIPALTCAEEELADIVIRALDTAKGLGVDMARAVYWKDRFNQTRSFRHGNKNA